MLSKSTIFIMSLTAAVSSSLTIATLSLVDRFSSSEAYCRQNESGDRYCRYSGFVDRYYLHSDGTIRLFLKKPFDVQQAESFGFSISDGRSTLLPMNIEIQDNMLQLIRDSALHDVKIEFHARSIQSGSLVIDRMWSRSW